MMINQILFFSKAVNEQPIKCLSNSEITKEYSQVTTSSYLTAQASIAVKANLAERAEDTWLEGPFTHIIPKPPFFYASNSPLELRGPVLGTVQALSAPRMGAPPPPHHPSLLAPRALLFFAAPRLQTPLFLAAALQREPITASSPSPVPITAPQACEQWGGPGNR